MEITENLGGLKVWRRLIPDKLAVTLLEQAEYLSKEGRVQDSIRAFRRAARLFSDIEAFLNLKDREPIEELTEKMRDAARLSKMYCLARIDMEEARISKLEGDYESSIRSYASATEKFERITEMLERKPFREASTLEEVQRGSGTPADARCGRVSSGDRVSTGYEPLDGLLYGGIPKNYSVILTSPPCDEKDLLLRRFLEKDAEEWVTFYVSANISRVTDVLERNPPNLYAFIYNSQSGLIASKHTNVYGIKNLEDLSSINISLGSVLSSLDEKGDTKKRRICIDILSDVLLRLKALTSRRWLSELIPRLKSRGFTIVATLNPYMHPREETSAIIDLFDGHIDIYEKEEQGRTEFLLRIRRMYGQRYVRKELRLDRDLML